MRKYLLFIYSFSSLLLLFSFTQVSTVQAGTAKEGELCVSNAGALGNQAQICESRYDCNTTDHDDKVRELLGPLSIVLPNQGICVPKPGFTALSCKCQAGNQDGSGRNGFTCGPDPNSLDPNKVVFCHDSRLTCRDSMGSVTFAETTENGGTVYPNSEFKDVVCEEPAAVIAQCKCVGGGTNQQNNFECTGTDPQTNQQMMGTAFCGDGKFKCYDRPGFEYTGPVSQQMGALFLTETPVVDGVGGNALKSVAVTGIDCRQPDVTCRCAHPGRSGTRINRIICEQITGDPNKPLKGTSYCNESNQACIDDPNGQVTNPQTNTFNGAPLKGVRCEEVPISPPPAPPCADAFDPEGRCPSFLSAFGKLNTDPGGFITSVFALLLSMSGGIALLLIMRAGYILMTSSGNPEKVSAGREQLVAAIVGLLFIIFSFVILQVIGVEVLRIPGFGGSNGGGGSPRGALCTNNNQCASGTCGTAPSGPGGNSGQCQ